MGKPVVQAAAPRAASSRSAGAAATHTAVDDADLANPHVVRAQVERGTAAQVKAGMMPMAGENAVFNAAAVQRPLRVAALACSQAGNLRLAKWVQGSVCTAVMLSRRGGPGSQVLEMTTVRPEYLLVRG